ncbi:MAG: NAD(P)H-dependent oxidoreductase subunit E [bacterium]
MEQSATDFLTQCSKKRSGLIAILQKVQNKYGYISKSLVSDIAKYLGVSEAEVFGVATFYTQFRFTRPAKHNITVCLGTACYVRGGAKILETFEQELNIKIGEKTKDYNFELERVACVGCCALSPVVVVDKTVQTKMTSTKATNFLKNLKTEK